MTRLRLLLAAALIVGIGLAATPATAPPDLQATIQAVQGGLTNLPAGAAVDNIDGWRDALQNSPNPTAQEVYRDLGSLRSELTSGSIDAERVGRLLVSMGSNTQRLSIAAEDETAAGLSRLGGLLVDAGFTLL